MALALDGKSAPLNRPAGRDDGRMLVAAVAHGSGLVLGQTASDSAGGETAHGLTSLPPERAGPAEVLALNRGHWEFETRLHYVRDVAYDEDRSRIRCGRLPRNLACLSNAAISIVRLRGRFDGQPRRPGPRLAGKTRRHRPHPKGTGHATLRWPCLSRYMNCPGSETFRNFLPGLRPMN